MGPCDAYGKIGHMVDAAILCRHGDPGSSRSPVV